MPLWLGRCKMKPNGESIGWHWVDHTDPLPGERAPYHCFIEALVGSTLQSTWVFENGVYPQTAILMWKINDTIIQFRGTVHYWQTNRYQASLQVGRVWWITIGLLPHPGKRVDHLHLDISRCRRVENLEQSSDYHRCASTTLRSPSAPGPVP